MPESFKPIPVVFWRSATGREPVREWLNELSREDKRAIGRDVAKVQYGWPVGLPLCRPLSGGLWEVRASLPSKREARIFFGFHDGMLIALHAIIKKTQRTPQEELTLARLKIQGIAIMARKNPHIGSSFESWLEDAGIREEVTATAIKAVIARQLASEMKKKKITKQRMAELMKTSRAQVDRLLDPDNGSATIESLQRAAKIVGRELRLQLV
jgi:phage-related protein/predicted XRE-type DNA-binding protein